MKIIFGVDSFETEKHAKKILTAISQVEDQFPHRAMPRGIAYHLAKYTHVCDECGQTYWVANEWATHLGCPGAPNQKDKGFGFNT